MNDLVLEKKKRMALLWWATLVYFVLFSFNALATSTLAALIGAKWELQGPQEKVLILVAIAANWTGLVLVFLQKSIGRIAHGQAPVETGDTKQITREGHP
jgi:hypothetical protein